MLSIKRKPSKMYQKPEPWPQSEQDTAHPEQVDEIADKKAKAKAEKQKKKEEEIYRRRMEMFYARCTYEEFLKLRARYEELCHEAQQREEKKAKKKKNAGGPE
ncbi:hypothetical protein FWP04_14250 [Salmonella enterica subsp. enterica serovar Mountpleasant]|nr:hypothetical protein [Salmonella enterica subsp. enterica serovar Mountpleasant]